MSAVKLGKNMANRKSILVCTSISEWESTDNIKISNRRKYTKKQKKTKNRKGAWCSDSGTPSHLPPFQSSLEPLTWLVINRAFVKHCITNPILYKQPKFSVFI